MFGDNSPQLLLLNIALLLHLQLPGSKFDRRPALSADLSTSLASTTVEQWSVETFLANFARQHFPVWETRLDFTSFCKGCCKWIFSFYDLSTIWNFGLILMLIWFCLDPLSFSLQEIFVSLRSSDKKAFGCCYHIKIVWAERVLPWECSWLWEDRRHRIALQWGLRTQRGRWRSAQSGLPASSGPEGRPVASSPAESGSSWRSPPPPPWEWLASVAI